MLKQTRLSYLIITLFVVLLGVLSRKVDGIPLCFGDILYAVMVYFGIRMLFIHFNTPQKTLIPLLFCYLIEVQQLCDIPWLVAIRKTTLGHYALGQGFLWSDICCYTVGVFVAFVIDFKLFKSTPKF